MIGVLSKPASGATKFSALNAAPQSTLNQWWLEVHAKTVTVILLYYIKTYNVLCEFPLAYPVIAVMSTTDSDEYGLALVHGCACESYLPQVWVVVHCIFTTY